MSPKADAIYQAVMELPSVERKDLVELLNDSVAENMVPPMSEAWHAEIARRSAEYDAGLVKGIPWSEVCDAASRIEVKGEGAERG